MEKQITIIFNNHKNNSKEDLKIPTDMSAMELIVGLNSAYQLNINTEDLTQCFLSTENPIRLLRGNKTLKEFDIHNGTIIHFL